MARKIITFICMLFAVLLTGVWLAQKSGEKIIYCDAFVARDFLPLRTLLRIQRLRGHETTSQPVQTHVFLTVKDGRLFVNRIGEVRYTGGMLRELEKEMFKLFGGPDNITHTKLISEWSFPLLPVIGAFLLVPFLLILPAQMRRWRRRRRMRNNECLGCGYSLVGNESGTCPECGGVAHLARSHVDAR